MADINGSVGWDVTAIDGVISQAMEWTTMVGVFLASSFVCLKLAFEYWRYSIGAATGNNPVVPWDWNEVVRVFLIVGLLAAYKPLAYGVTETIGAINSITDKSSETHHKLAKESNKWYINSKKAQANSTKKYLRERLNHYQAEGNQDKVKLCKKLLSRVDSNILEHQDGTLDGSTQNQKEKYEKTAESLNSGSMFNPFDSMFWANSINGLALLISGLIKWSIGTFYGALFKLCLCFGPLVLAFSIFFRDKGINFMNQMLNVGFTFTTINIIDMIVGDFIIESFNNPDVSESIAFNMAVIGMYWSVGRITKMFIGETGVNSIMARGLQTATAVVVAAFTAASTVASAATGGAGGGAVGKAVGSGISSAGQGIKKTGGRVD